MITLKGHTALVTGGTRGVGRAIAESLAQAGANIVLHGLQADSTAEEAVSAIRRLNVECQLVTANLAAPTEEAVDALFTQSISASADIDILISNAGTYCEPDFLGIDFATFEKTMRLNVFSHFFLIQRFARRWVGQGTGGRVLLTGSINGRLAEQTHSAYDTSKGAVDAMVRTLCVSLAPRGIRVNGMAPGLVRTPLTASALDQPGVTEWMKLHTPNQQVPGSEVCGPTAAFLVSDLASHIHGQMVLVDGGMSARQQPDPPRCFTHPADS
ncbi:MAG: SDR family NAD(P)-dependent oxidoreductase [Planctomycetota bacterium]|nr:SDR family NAD(P)-dependent oxidoreductase [Planctomycetota bacterium]